MRPSTTARTVIFTVTDKNANAHSDTQTVTVTAVNDAPTLTAFSVPVQTGDEDSQMTVTFVNLVNRANEADVEHGPLTIASVVKGVRSGSVVTDTSADAATA